VHQVRGWSSGAAAYFGWMREAKREHTRGGLRPMSDKAASQKTRSPEGCDEKWAGGCVAPQSRINSDRLLRRALPAARFDRNAAIPVTDLVH